MSKKIRFISKIFFGLTAISILINAASAATQWTYIGTFTDTRWFVDTSSIKYEKPNLISLEIKGGDGAYFNLQLNCTNRTMSMAYQAFEAVPNTKNVASALLNRFCFPMR